jgi:hypothetical protein
MRACQLALLVGLLPGCVIMGDGVAKSQEREVDAFDTIEITDIVDVAVLEGAPVDSLLVSCDGNVIDMIDTRVSGGVLTVGIGGGGASTSTECKVVTGNMNIVEIISLGIADVTVQGPAWSLDTIRSESVGNIRIDLRDAQLDDEAFQEGEELQNAPEDEAGDEAEELQNAPEDEAGDEAEELQNAPEDEAGDEAEEQPMPVAQADHLFIESLDLGEIRVTGLDRSSVEVRAEGVGEIELEGMVEQLDIELIDLTDVDARDLAANDVYVYSDGVGDITVTALELVDIENRGIGSITVYGDPAERSVINDSVGDVDFR